jgi:hypothetical protein
MKENLDQMATRYDTTVIGLAVMAVKFSFRGCNSVLAPLPEGFTREEARYIEESAPIGIQHAVKLITASIESGLCRI